jgi:hypothetical protein
MWSLGLQFMGDPMAETQSNKAFVAEMLGEKRQLDDYPGRFDPELMMYEPASLPFGGAHHGLDAFKKFYPEVRDFYDFDTFALRGVYGDGDTVFATFQVGLRESPGTVMFVAEEFTFSGTTLVEVRVHICDAKPG